MPGAAASGLWILLLVGHWRSLDPDQPHIV